MAQQALTAGMTVPRRRALFGLLDADGWAWASVKALVWTTIIILMLGYIPDRAYYLTVAKTVDLGVIVWSPINLCPPENKNLPCPVPVGGIVPWDTSPAELSLPQPRTDGNVVQVGTRLLYIGGTDGKTAQSTVFVANDGRDRELRQVDRGSAAAGAAYRGRRRVRRRQRLRAGRPRGRWRTRPRRPTS